MRTHRNHSIHRRSVCSPLVPALRGEGLGARGSWAITKPVSTTGSSRRGTVLFVVLIAVVMLSFGAYSFSELMLSEHVVSRHLIHQLEMRCQLESASETVAAAFDSRFKTGRDVQQDWRKVLSNSHVVASGGQSAPSASVHVFSTRDEASAFIAAAPSNLEGSAPEMLNESTRLNINALPTGKHQRKLARIRLMALPAMTPHIADALLDWMDSDDDPSEFGAESSYYTTLARPYRPRQDRFTSIDELLLVRGVTPELLYGGSDSTGPASGWASLITLHSAESNLRRDGATPKINVNHPNLAELFDALQREFHQDAARFVVAWRLAGSVGGSEDQRQDNPQAGTLVATTVDPYENFDLFEAEKDSARRRIKQQLGNDDEDFDAGSTGVAEKDRSHAEVRRAGIVVSRTPAYAIRSVVDLIGTDVRIDVDRKDTVLHSPWSGDAKSLDASLRLLESRLTTTDEPVVAGRINIDRASPEILLTIPDITPAQVETILKARSFATRRETFPPEPRGLAWLVTDNVMPLRELRQMAPYITSGGEVWSGVTVVTRPGSAVRVASEFMIDASQYPSRICAWREIELNPASNPTRARGRSRAPIPGSR